MNELTQEQLNQLSKLDEYGTTYSVIDQEAYRQLEIKFNYRYCNKI